MKSYGSDRTPLRELPSNSSDRDHLKATVDMQPKPAVHLRFLKSALKVKREYSRAKVAISDRLVMQTSISRE